MSNKNKHNKPVAKKDAEVENVTDISEVEAVEAVEEIAVPEIVEVVEQVVVQAAEAEPSWPLTDWYGFVLPKIGQPYYVLAGAMEGMDAEAEYTETEIRRKVENFLNSPVE